MAHEAEYETVFHCERQPDGWPKGMTPKEKTALTEAVTHALHTHPEGLSRDQIYRWLKQEKRWPLQWVVYSGIYCAIDRACRAAGAEQVYTLNAPQW